MAYPAVPKTWVAGDVLTAAQLNAELRDALLGAFPLGPPDVAWTSFTPTLTQGATVTKTVTSAKYTRVGRLIVCNVAMSVTGAGTAATTIVSGLPVTPLAIASQIVGTGFVYDASTGLIYLAIMEMSTGATVQFRPTTITTNGFLGSLSMTAALAAGDLISYSVVYESAT